MPPRTAAPDLLESHARVALDSPARRAVPPLLLALSVQWDDCSAALGGREGVAMEVSSHTAISTLPKAGADNPGKAMDAVAGPLASRNALLLVDRLLVGTNTPLAAVDRLCFARGPGAFTSLRVAAGLIQGLSLATSIPVAGICSLAAMVAQQPAWQAANPDPDTSWLQISAIDARMGECYFGVHQFQSGRYPVPLAAPAVGSPAEAVAVFDEVLAQRGGHRANPGVVLAGSAFRLLPDLAAWCARNGFDAGQAAARSPTAAAVLAVAASPGAPEAGPARTALPVYVRDKIALDVNEQRAGAAARTLAAGIGSGA